MLPPLWPWTKPETNLSLQARGTEAYHTPHMAAKIAFA